MENQKSAPSIDAFTLNRFSNTTKVLSEMTPVRQTKDYQIFFDRATQFYVVHFYKGNVNYCRTLELANQLIQT
jgi:hypothetical protein